MRIRYCIWIHPHHSLGSILSANNDSIIIFDDRISQLLWKIVECKTRGKSFLGHTTFPMYVTFPTLLPSSRVLLSFQQNALKLHFILIM